MGCNTADNLEQFNRYHEQFHSDECHKVDWSILSTKRLQHDFDIISRDRNSTARLMNATSNLATYQYEDISTDVGVTPVNFPRTRDQFNALTGKNPQCFVFFISSDCLACSCSSHGNANSIRSWSWWGCCCSAPSLGVVHRHPYWMKR